MRNKIYLWLSVFWTLLIIFLCLGVSSDFPVIKVDNLDKFVHFSLHLVFVFNWYLYFESKKQAAQSKLKLNLFLVSLLFGITIEIIQGALTKTRSADVFDVIANSFGAVLALLLIGLFENYFSKDSK